jgi:hypothetical protein
MNRVVYRGGFGNGQMSADHVGNALSDYYDSVEVFTDTSATRNASDFVKASKGSVLWTHSKGYTGIRESSPTEIVALSPSLPASRLRLLGGALVKGARMLSDELTLGADKRTVLKYNASAVGELIAHPVGNFWPLLKGSISKTDSIQLAAEAKEAGVHTHMLYFTDDEMFEPHFGQRIEAASNGTPIIDIPGVHDQIVLTPHQTIKTALDIINS